MIVNSCDDLFLVILSSDDFKINMRPHWACAVFLFRGFSYQRALTSLNAEHFVIRTYELSYRSTSCLDRLVPSFFEKGCDVV